jgi:YVTN family beta-propeller protein
VGEPSDVSRSSQTDTSRDGHVHAFLIADVRGWTRFTRERGDEDAARLAGRLAEVTRSVVEAHRGRVLELRGDEAMVVFGSPRSAIRGAVALQRRFVEETIADPSLPLTVGVGLDAGEAVPVEGGYRGGALNVAARLCSLARAGEVLASREIVHLALRVDGVRFTERGPSSVKGLEKPVHVVAVCSEDRDEAEAIAPFVRPSATPHRNRWKAVAALVGFAVVAALVAVPLVTRDQGAGSQITPNSIGVLDPSSGAVTETIPLEERPGAIAASADSLWVTNPDAGTVTRIDADDREVRDSSIRVDEDPTAIAVGADAVWVVNGGGPTVSRISPETNEVVKTIAVGNGPAGIAVDPRGVWVTNRFDGTVWRIDPDTSEVVEKIPVGLDPRGIAIGSDGVWVALAGSNEVVRIDPRTNAVEVSVPVGNAPGWLAVSEDAVWVANTLDDTVQRIDPETEQAVDTIPVGDGPSGISVFEGTAWVTNEFDGTLSRIEPGQASASPLAIGSIPQGVLDAYGELWVSVRGGATAHTGGTLRVLSRYPPQSFDPAVSYSYIDARFQHLLGDGLLAFKAIGGVEGTSLVADLATDVPTPSNGGTRYTFRLRPDIRYSNGDLVVPGDFRHAIERGFRIPIPYNQDVHSSFFGGLVGGEACERAPRTCDLSDGIVTDDDTITFNLEEADPDFLSKLTMPFAYPIPLSVPDEEQVEAGVPGTGPYELDAPMTDDGDFALVRNQYFDVWSAAAQPAGFVDRIEWTSGVEPNAQVEAVTNGEADLAFDADSSSRLEDIIVEFPAQIHTSLKPVTSYVVLDTSTPPFDDPGVRRALNSVIDRHQVIRIFGGEATGLPTCQQLPPNLPGYEPYCPYSADPGSAPEGTWTAPAMGLEEARRVVQRSGSADIEVVMEYPPEYWGPQGQAFGNYMIGLLESLGFEASVRPISVGAFYNPDNEFQMAFDAFLADYPAPSNFITGFFDCDGTFSPSAATTGYCDRRLDAMIRRARGMQLTDPSRAVLLWAKIDREIVDRAPYVWLENFIAVELVSERVGNYQWSRQSGSLLNQLWVV